ncbi:hypothetical protein PR048_022371 [Dryococelus australis]|uniref:Uncharacterized protein n=1 Tax=Dryococelus australis TaxID=614101 RepID=A0ABQ9H0Y8_9NEOP|nr:hypothetical protein PR048_022371 [Dryococelus australis]
MHVRKVDSSYKHLNADIKKSKDTNASLEVLAFNMQQTLPAFYHRKLLVYNECVHVCSTNDSSMVIWVEGQSKRGSSEVASAFLKVINELRKKKILPNFFIVALWSYAIQRGFASKIHHKFLVSGQKFLPCDRDFSRIEKMKRTHINEIHTSKD